MSTTNIDLVLRSTRKVKMKKDFTSKTRVDQGCHTLEKSVIFKVREFRKCQEN